MMPRIAPFEIVAPPLVAAALRAVLSGVSAAPEGAIAPPITIAFGNSCEALDTHALQRPAQIVWLTYANPAALSAATRLGIQVMVGVDEGCTVLREAIQAARQSEAYCSPSLLPALLQALRSAAPSGVQPEPVTGEVLSERELEVARLVASGHSNEQVAATLFVCESTVKFHLGSVYRKLGISRRGQLASQLPAFALHG